MDYVNGIFLVFSGAALGFYVGYLLFFRDRTADDKLQRSLKNENNDLKTSLKLAHDSHQKLESSFSRQTGQLHTLQQLCDDWTISREQSDKQLGELNEALRTKTQLLDELQSELKTEKQSRVKLEDSKHLMQQKFTEQRTIIDDTWRKQAAKSDITIDRLKSRLTRSDQDKQRVGERLGAAEAQVAELHNELEYQQTLLAAASSNAKGLEQEYVSLESLLHDSSEQLKASMTDSAALESAKRAAEESLTELVEENKTLKAEIVTLQDQVIELESLQPQLDTLNKAMETNAERLASVVNQRDQAIEAENIGQNVVAGLHKRIDNQESTIHRLRDKYDQSMEDLKRELTRGAELESELQDSLSQINRLTEAASIVGQLTAQRDGFATELENAQRETSVALSNHQQKIDELVVENNQMQEQYTSVCSESETLAKQCEELTELLEDQEQAVGQLEVRVREQSAEIVELTQYRDRLTEELSTQEALLVDTRDELSTQEALLVNASNKLTAQEALLLNASNELTTANSLMAKSDNELKQSQQTTAKLTAELEELTVVRQRISELELLASAQQNDHSAMEQRLKKLSEDHAEALASNETLEAMLDQLQTQRDGQLLAVSRHDSQVQFLQNKLSASEETIRTLRKERAAVLARLANYRTIAEPDAHVISFTEAMEIRKRKEQSYDDEYGGPVRRHATRGMIYTQAPKLTDDLKRISGIAEVLEARLNDYGIFTFKQIMNWTPEAIEEFSHLLTFKDRIDRDDWISQARFFYQEKQRAGKSYAA